MSYEMLIVFAILGGAAILFATNAIRSDIVAMLVVSPATFYAQAAGQSSRSGFRCPDPRSRAAAESRRSLSVGLLKTLAADRAGWHARPAFSSGS